VLSSWLSCGVERMRGLSVHQREPGVVVEVSENAKGT